MNTKFFFKLYVCFFFCQFKFILLNRFENKIFKIVYLLRSDKWARMNADGSVDISQGSGTCPYWSKVSYFTNTHPKKYFLQNSDV